MNSGEGSFALSELMAIYQTGVRAGKASLQRSPKGLRAVGAAFKNSFNYGKAKFIRSLEGLRAVTFIQEITRDFALHSSPVRSDVISSVRLYTHCLTNKFEEWKPGGNRAEDFSILDAMREVPDFLNIDPQDLHRSILDSSGVLDFLEIQLAGEKEGECSSQAAS